MRLWRWAEFCALLGATLFAMPAASYAQAAAAGPQSSVAGTSGSSSAKANPAAPSHSAGATHSTSKSTTAHKTATHSKTSSGKNRGKTARTKAGARSSKYGKKRGQQVIDSDRAREIQQALIREHYLQGEPSGRWDAETQAAMVKYQADQGWQSKTIPDSRALIKLGLGPSKDGLLNPESAMTSEPPADPKMPAKSNPANPAASTQSNDRPQQ